MNLKQRAVRGVLWATVQIWGGNAISLLALLVLARLLDQAAFGIVAIAYVFTNLTQILQDQGFSAAIIQRREVDGEHLDTAFWMQVGVSLVFAALIALASSQIAAFFEEPMLAAVLPALAARFVIESLTGVHQALLRRELKFKRLALRRLAGGVAGGIVGVSCAFGGLGVWSLVAQNLTDGVVSAAILWWAVDWRPTRRVSRAKFVELFKFGMPVTGVECVTFVTAHMDRLLIGKVLGSALVGAYGNAASIITRIGACVSGSVSTVGFSTFSKLQHEKERLREAFLTPVRAVALVAFPLFLLLAALAEDVILVMLGPKWSAAVGVLRVLSFLGLLQSVSLLNASLIMATGRPDLLLATRLVRAAFNVIAITIAWLAGASVVGVALAVVIAAYLYAILPVAIVRSLIGVGFRDVARALAGPAAAAVIATAAVLAARTRLPVIDVAVLRLAAYGGIGTVVYGTAALVLAKRQVEALRGVMTALRTNRTELGD